MALLTKEEFIVTKYFTELQLNNCASEETYDKLIALLRTGESISNGFLFNSLTISLLGDYLYNEEMFFQEYKKLRLDKFFLSEDHMADMRERLILLDHLHIGALKEEIVPGLIEFVQVIESYDDIKDTTLKGVYNAILDYLYRRGGLRCNINFTASLIEKIDKMRNVYNSDFFILDIVLGGKPYNYDQDY